MMACDGWLKGSHLRDNTGFGHLICVRRKLVGEID